jgi:hypothetical protein
MLVLMAIEHGYKEMKRGERACVSKLAIRETLRSAVSHGSEKLRTSEF